MKAICPLLILGSLLLFAGCDQKPKDPVEPPKEPTATATSTKTYETVHVERAIDAYIKYPSPGNEAEVERALAELSTEIALVQNRAAKATGEQKNELEALARRLIEFQEQQALRFARAKADAKKKEEDSLSEKAREAGEKAKEAAREAGNVVREALKEAAEATEEAARRAKEKLDPGNEE